MKTRTHPLEWAALGCAVVSLSYTEWSLAVAAGAHPLVAVAVPGAMDIYAIRAMRVRRHVPYVVLAMVGVNALSYLVHAGVVPVTWPVLVVVSAIAPLVFWAVHNLGHGDHVPRNVAQDAGLENIPNTLEEHLDTLPVPVDEWGTDVRVLDTDPYPEDCPELGAPAVVLPLPSGYERENTPGTRRTREQLIEHGLSVYENDPDTPTVRQIKEELKCGTAGAQAVLDALKERNEEKR